MSKGGGCGYCAKVYCRLHTLLFLGITLRLAGRNGLC